MDIKLKDKNGATLHTAKKYIKEDIKVVLDDSLIPSGTIEITENGEYDVASYEKADVKIKNTLFKNMVETNITKLTAEELEDVTKIGNYAFNKSLLTEIEFPDSVTSVGQNAFQDSTSLEKVIMTNNVTKLDSYAFNRCTALKNITLSKNLTSCGNGTFDNSGLVSVTVPSSLKTIAHYMFQNCTSLISVRIEAGVTKINDGSFRYCTNLKEIICLNETPLSIYHNSFTSVPEDCVIKVPANSVDAYKTATNWSDRADYIMAYEGV